METNLTPNGMELQVIEVLKTCYDPEIPVNIYEMGLIYEVKVDAKGFANVKMTLTSPMCPVAESLPPEVRIRSAISPGSAMSKSRSCGSRHGIPA